MSVVVLCGPTATGKTRLGLFLADYLKTPVLSADSRQVYCEFDIGTAKPTVAERAAIEHRLIDIAQPTETFNVALYRAAAQVALAEIHSLGRPALFVGGSGLYLRAMTGGLELPEAPPDAHLRALLLAQDADALHRQLQSLDPIAAGRIHPHDRVRLVRAVEVCLTTGNPLATQQRRTFPPYPVLNIGLRIERPDLIERIEQRTRQMVKAGWLAEVESLRAKYGPELPLLQTLGYREIGAYLDGLTNLKEALERTSLLTRQFAKRQMTWFRREPGIHWLDATLPEAKLQAEAQSLIDAFLNRRGP